MIGFDAVGKRGTKPVRSPHFFDMNRQRPAVKRIKRVYRRPTDGGTDRLSFCVGCGSGSQRRHVTLGRSARDSDARFRSGRPAQALGLSPASRMGAGILIILPPCPLASMLEIRRGQLEPPFYICAQYPSKSRRVGLFVQPFQQSHPAVATLVANFFLYRVVMDSGRLSWLSSPSCFKCDGDGYGTRSATAIEATRDQSVN